MKIHTIAVLIAHPDYELLTQAADIHERTLVNPRARPSIKDFILESALKEAEAVIKANEQKKESNGTYPEVTPK